MRLFMGFIGLTTSLHLFRRWNMRKIFKQDSKNIFLENISSDIFETYNLYDLKKEGEEEEEEEKEKELDPIQKERSKYIGNFLKEMNLEEAKLILGFDTSSSPNEQQIKIAHRKLMMLNHPDSGGSTFIATKLNEAKMVLLGKVVEGIMEETTKGGKKEVKIEEKKEQPKEDSFPMFNEDIIHNLSEAKKDAFWIHLFENMEEKKEVKKEEIKVEKRIAKMKEDSKIFFSFLNNEPTKLDIVPTSYIPDMNYPGINMINGRFYYIVKIPLLKEDEKIPLADYGVDIEKGLFFKLNLDDKYIAAKKVGWDTRTSKKEKIELEEIIPYNHPLEDTAFDELDIENDGVYWKDNVEDNVD